MLLFGLLTLHAAVLELETYVFVSDMYQLDMTVLCKSELFSTADKVSPHETSGTEISKPLFWRRLAQVPITCVTSLGLGAFDWKLRLSIFKAINGDWWLRYLLWLVNIALSMTWFFIPKL